MKRTIFAILKIKPHIPLVSKYAWRLFLVSGLFLSQMVTGCYYKTVEFTSLEDPVLEDCKIISAEDKQRGRITFNNYGARYQREWGSIKVISTDEDTFTLVNDQIDKLITSEVKGEQFDEERLPALTSVLQYNGKMIFSGFLGFNYVKKSGKLICFTDRDNPFSADLSEIKEFYYAKHSFITPQRLSEKTIPAVKKVILKDSDFAIPVKMILHEWGTEYIAGVSDTFEKIIIPKDDLISLEAEVFDGEATAVSCVFSGMIATVLVLVLINHMEKSSNWGDIKLMSPIHEHALSGSGR